MIEIIQQTSKTEENLEGRLPKNIRQIGNPEKDFRIYMEDYVYTYLHPAQINGMEMGILPRLLILLGEINHFSNRSCAFISGAIQVENKEQPEELPEFNESTWRRIHTEMQRFFDKCEIVGWVLDIPGNTLEVSREMEEMHRINFVGKYQFFFLMDSREREEAFYTWKEGQLRRKEGYFIYYEKNPQMQEYMISKKESLFGDKPFAEEVSDHAAKNYRAMMMQKKEQNYKGKGGILSYLTSILTVIILCSVSVLLLSNIRRMENMEKTISVMSDAIESTETKGSKTAENVQNQVAIETISSNVIPIEEDTIEEPVKQTKEPDKATEQDSLPNQSPAEPIPEAKEEETASNQPEDPAEHQEETKQEPADQEKAKKDGQTSKEAEQYLEQGYYIVQAGDSLRQICYNIYQTHAMLDALCEANNIEDQDTIYAGQKIILPK